VEVYADTTRASHYEYHHARVWVVTDVHFPVKNRGQEMKERKAAWILLFALLGIASAARTQNGTPPARSDQQTRTSANTNAQNIQEYADLLRSNVRQQKAEIMGSMMQLSAADAAKFWPIYDEYDAKLNTLNDQRVANIKEYANSYTQMTDKQADNLVRKAFEYRRQRSELLETYYGRVEQKLGAITAARFAQIEDQLLLIMDLQIDSSLPIVAKSS
jgi:hypothetical protein